MMYHKFLFGLVFTFLASNIQCRKHQLVLDNDSRNYFRISKFGFWQDGKLEFKLNQLTFHSKFAPKLGFTMTKTVSASITPYMETQQNRCLLADDALTEDGNIKIISFLLDLTNNQLLVNCTSLFPFLTIKAGPGFNMTLSEAQIPHYEPLPEPSVKKRSITDKGTEDTKAPSEEINKKNPELDPKPNNPEVSNVTQSKSTDAVALGGRAKTCNSLKVPFKSEIVGQRRKISDFQFQILMEGPESLGLYSLYFHNCPEPDEPSFPVNLSISIVEQNDENYLSAGEMPLPNLYFFMSFVFFVTGCVWIAVLRKKREEVFKIHYLMAILVYLKSLSLLFHGINYHIIARDGYPMEAWAVLYYITHLLKGALLFITIVLIGTGWAFIKHILSDKDKKIFMIVIPLQVLANVAKIIMEESEEGDSQHYTWKEIFILVDLICCGAILFPVVWSIRHLQEASHTDGKAAINLEKLKLFRHFYVMIICYIYFTRIIVYLLKITVIFQYEWLDEFFREVATFTFFIVTGINFQPTASNPYFRLSQEDDLEMEEVITQTGFTKNASKTVRSRDTAAQNEDGMTTKRESSHEYD